MPRHATTEPVTAERIERALVLAAYIVVRHGEKYAPIFDSLERDLIEMRKAESPATRAARFLQDHTTVGAVKAIR